MQPKNLNFSIINFDVQVSRQNAANDLFKLVIKSTQKETQKPVVALFSCFV